MHQRDIRPLFSLKQFPVISPKENCMIVSFGSMKVLIEKTKVLVFNPNLNKLFIDKLQEQIKNNSSYIFHIIVLEFVIEFVFKIFDDAFNNNSKQIQQILDKLKTSFADVDFEKLLSLKKNLIKMQRQVSEIEELTEQILKDDNEIQEICFYDDKIYEDIESILENGWEQFEDLFHRIEELSENIDDTQEIITLKMASRRNTIIKVDLFATMITVVFSFFAVLVGAFGMNIKNTLEDSVLTFYLILCSIFLVSFFFGIFVLKYFKKRKIL